MSGFSTNKTQEAVRAEKCNLNTTGIPISKSKDMTTVTDNNDAKINYFIPGTQQEAEKRASAEITQNYIEVSHVLSGIGCFDGKFSL